MKYKLIDENIKIYSDLLPSIKQTVISFEGTKLMYGQSFDKTNIEKFALVIEPLQKDIENKEISEENRLAFKMVLQLHYDRLKRWNNFVMQIKDSQYDNTELVRRMHIIENDICNLEKELNPTFSVQV